MANTVASCGKGNERRGTLKPLIQRRFGAMHHSLCDGLGRAPSKTAAAPQSGWNTLLIQIVALHDDAAIKDLLIYCHQSLTRSPSLVGLSRTEPPRRLGLSASSPRAKDSPPLARGKAAALC